MLGTGDPELLAAFKRQARQRAEQRYSQKVGVQAFAEIIERVYLRPAPMKDKT